jgi:hypothetical protein
MKRSALTFTNEELQFILSCILPTITSGEEMTFHPATIEGRVKSKIEGILKHRAKLIKPALDLLKDRPKGANLTAAQEHHIASLREHGYSIRQIVEQTKILYWKVYQSEAMQADRAKAKKQKLAGGIDSEEWLAL